MPFKRILTSKPVLIVEAIIIIFFAFNVGKEVLRRRALADEVRKLEADIGRLEQNKSELAALLDYVKTDTFVEAEARSKLNLAKDGEKLVLVPEIDSLPAPASAGEVLVSLGGEPVVAAAPKPKPNIVRWWDYFFEHERLWME